MTDTEHRIEEIRAKRDLDGDAIDPFTGEAMNDVWFRFLRAEFDKAQYHHDRSTEDGVMSKETDPELDAIAVVLHCTICGVGVKVRGSNEGTCYYVNADGSAHVCEHHIGDVNKMVALGSPLINAAQAWYAGGTDDQGLREAVARFRASTATDAPVVTRSATTDSEMPEWVAEEIHAARAQALRSLGLGRVHHGRARAAIVWLTEDRERLLIRVEDERRRANYEQDAASEMEQSRLRAVADRAALANRSWALSAILAHINHRELARIALQLTIPEIDRFIAVNNGYEAEIRAAHPQPEDTNAR